MLQFQLRNRSGHTRRFHQIVFGWTPAPDSAERTGPGANIAKNHERCRAVFAPTLGNIRAHRILADCVEMMGAQNPADLEVIFSAGNTDLEPARSITHM